MLRAHPADHRTRAGQQAPALARSRTEPSQVRRSDLFASSTSNSTDAPWLLAGKAQDLNLDRVRWDGVHVAVAPVASLARNRRLHTIAFVHNRPDGPRPLRRRIDPKQVDRPTAYVQNAAVSRATSAAPVGE